MKIWVITNIYNKIPSTNPNHKPDSRSQKGAAEVLASIVRRRFASRVQRFAASIVCNYFFRSIQRREMCLGCQVGSHINPTFNTFFIFIV
jgi:hypothetical protein